MRLAARARVKKIYRGGLPFVTIDLHWGTSTNPDIYRMQNIQLMVGEEVNMDWFIEGVLADDVNWLDTGEQDFDEGL